MMKHLFTAAILAGLMSFGLAGCSETNKSTTTKETEIDTPSGTTTITTEKEVKQTGDNPPATTP